MSNFDFSEKPMRRAREAELVAASQPATAWHRVRWSIFWIALTLVLCSFGVAVTVKVVNHSRETARQEREIFDWIDLMAENVSTVNHIPHGFLGRSASFSQTGNMSVVTWQSSDGRRSATLVFANNVLISKTVTDRR